jgi:transposase InsO family protein/transposase-like protein
VERKAEAKRRKTRRTYRRYHTTEFKLRVVLEVLDEHVPATEVARVFGVHPHSVYDWVKQFRRLGQKGLGTERPGPKPKPKVPDARREAVVSMKKAFPNFGSRRIADGLKRFDALGVSDTQVRRILHEAGLLGAQPAATPKAPPPERRFERAEPNQLWQSDIFSFLLRRHQRVYLTAFMDDNSRFLVSHVLAHHQKGSLTVEALERGVAAYGVPREVLTDNGRQYTAWRGTTAFEELLRQYGIRHIKSRPQHPMTVGKMERFWKTLWDEFLSRTVFADFADCERRLELYVKAYNFRRTHQGIGGLVPADRFFRAAPQVREAIEKNVAENALRLSLEQPTRKPFYLVGRLGDKDVSIAAAGDGLHVQLGDEKPQTIQLPKENNDEAHQEPPRIHAARQAQSSPSPADAEVARPGAGPRRDGEAPADDGALGALGREGGDGRDSRDEHLAPAVLPARDEGAAGDAQGARAWERAEWNARRGWDGAEDSRARGAGEATEPGEAAHRAAAVPDAQGGEEGADDERDARPTEEGEVLIDEQWAQLFDAVDDTDGDELPLAGCFDVDEGWREQPLTWARKLAGADAPEGIDERREREEGERLREGAAGATLGEPALRSGDGGAGGEADGGGGSAPAWLVSEPLPDAHAPSAAWLHHGAAGQAARPAAEAGEGSGAGEGARGAEEGERQAQVPGGHGRPAARSGERPGGGEAEALGPKPPDGRGAGGGGQQR